MIDLEGLERSAHELRAAFDRAFAAPPPGGAEEVIDLLSVRVGGDPFAIRLRDIRGVFARRPVVAIPSGAPSVLGVAGIRGDIVPVFSLSSLLGYGDDREPPTWTVLCTADRPIGLGFRDLEGYLRIPSSARHPDEHPHVTKKYVTELASTAAGVRPVIAVPLIISDIRNRRGAERPERER
jgi:purine-binding chemotaxis protein CheW